MRPLPRRRSFLLVLAVCLGSVSALGAGAASAESTVADSTGAGSERIAQVQAGLQDVESFVLSDALKAELFAVGAFALLAHAAHHSARKAKKTAQRSG